MENNELTKTQIRLIVYSALFICKSNSITSSFGELQIRELIIENEKQIPIFFANDEVTLSNFEFVDEDSPAATRGRFSHPKKQALLQAEKAFRAENIAKSILKLYDAPKERAADILGKHNLTDLAFPGGCDAVRPEVFDVNDTNSMPLCVLKKYRSYDGSCNNPKYQDWGKAFTKYRRLLPPDYGDGLSSPRNSSVTGDPLPCVRMISRTVFTKATKDDDHPHWSYLFATFGQFLDHDITNTPPFSVCEDCPPLKCCGVESMPEECFPIDLCDDPIYKEITCMEFTRSLPALNTDCKLEFREQMNQVTSFIDGSQIYGSTEKEAQVLKDPISGYLRSTPFDDFGLLLNKGLLKAQQCLNSSETMCDFVAGDNRVNVFTPLTAMHTLWIRQHNRIVDILRNQSWTDPNDLYHMARHIVGAQLQHITYNEFLDIVFLESRSQFPELNLQNNVDYEISVNPSIVNEFATAGFRFGHSMVSGNFSLINNKQKKLKPEHQISNHFFFPYDLYKEQSLDNYFRGQLDDKAQKTNNLISSELTTLLFKKHGTTKLGQDLASLNIQRGRDHGMPSYTALRKFCNLSVPQNFEELVTVVTKECLPLLNKSYEKVEDIDLYVGGLCEDSDHFGAVGPTFGCILADQFSRLRKGDRFFYDRVSSISGLKNLFTQDQINEIKKTTLALIICQNTEVEKIRKSVMLTGDLENCSNIEGLDWSKFLFNLTAVNLNETEKG